MQDFLDDSCVPTIDQPLFSTVGMIDESVVIEAEELQDSRLEVVGGHNILDRAVTDFVGGSVGHAPLDPAAREPGREALAVVVAAGGRVGITFGDGKPADLSAPMDERRVEQPALLQVLDKGRGRLVGSATDRRQGILILV